MLTAAALLISASSPALAIHQRPWLEGSAFKPVSEWVCVNPHGKTAKYLTVVTTAEGTFKSIWSEDALRAELFRWSDDITPATWEDFKTVVADGQTALLPEVGRSGYIRVCAADPDDPLTSPETGAPDKF